MFCSKSRKGTREGREGKRKQSRRTRGASTEPEVLLQSPRHPVRSPEQPFRPECGFGRLVVFALIAAVTVHAVRVEHHLELVAGLLQGVHEQQGVLVMNIVISRAVGEAQGSRKGSVARLPVGRGKLRPCLGHRLRNCSRSRLRNRNSHRRRS